MGEKTRLFAFFASPMPSIFMPATQAGNLPLCSLVIFPRALPQLRFYRNIIISR